MTTAFCYNDDMLLAQTRYPPPRGEEELVQGYIFLTDSFSSFTTTHIYKNCHVSVAYAKVLFLIHESSRYRCGEFSDQLAANRATVLKQRACNSDWVEH